MQPVTVPPCIMPPPARSSWFFRRFRGIRSPHRASSSNRAISSTLDGAHVADSSSADGAHIAHAVLVALVAVLLAGVGSFPSVVPRRDARKKPVVRLYVFVVDELVVALGGQVEGAGDYAKRGEDQDGPRGGDKVEAGVKVPAVPEAGVVVVEEGHNSHARALHHGAKDQDAGCNLPASSSPLHATANNDDERDESAELDDDGEGDQKANRSPHIAEGWIFDAVRLPREWYASVVQRRTAAMETVGDLSLAIRDIADPSRHGNTRNRHNGTSNGEDEAHAIYESSRHGGDKDSVFLAERCV